MSRRTTIVLAAALALAAMPVARADDPLSSCQGTLSEGGDECPFTYVGRPVRIAGAIVGAAPAAGTIACPIDDCVAPPPPYGGISTPVIRVEVFGVNGPGSAPTLLASCGGAACVATSLATRTVGSALLCRAAVIFRPGAPADPKATAGTYACTSGA